MSATFDDQWLCERILVNDVHVAADEILSLYKDKILRAAPSESEVLYTVAPDIVAPSRADVSLETNLRAYFDLSLEQYPAWTNLETIGRVHAFFSFNHSMALGPWAAYLLAPGRPRCMVLHFDAHDDLASPKVGATQTRGVFAAPVGRATLDLRDGATIEEFVRRGFVGIGSFIVPLLHTVEELDLIHIDREAPETVQSFAIAPDWESYQTFTGTGISRPKVRLDASLEAARLSYMRTSDVRRALEHAAGRDVILDIDLDYFCNAFDNNAPPNTTALLSVDQVTCMIEELGENLNASGVVPSLVTIALSPGFFPSDYWKSALKVLRHMLAKI
ncbi:MAG: hypothetical protein H7Z40_00495 [Phycisphaerae bacterium]|nr:hypothetical protein [Gemmatimonadaceae bacterium]